MVEVRIYERVAVRCWAVTIDSTVEAVAVVVQRLYDTPVQISAVGHFSGGVPAMEVAAASQCDNSVAAACLRSGYRRGR